MRLITIFYDNSFLRFPKKKKHRPNLVGVGLELVIETEQPEADQLSGGVPRFIRFDDVNRIGSDQVDRLGHLDGRSIRCGVGHPQTELPGRGGNLRHRKGHAMAATCQLVLNGGVNRVSVPGEQVEAAQRKLLVVFQRNAEGFRATYQQILGSRQ